MRATGSVLGVQCGGKQLVRLGWKFLASCCCGPNIRHAPTRGAKGAEGATVPRRLVLWVSVGLFRAGYGRLQAVLLSLKASKRRV